MQQRFQSRRLFFRVVLPSGFVLEKPATWDEIVAVKGRVANLGARWDPSARAWILPPQALLFRFGETYSVLRDIFGIDEATLRYEQQQTRRMLANRIREGELLFLPRKRYIEDYSVYKMLTRVAEPQPGGGWVIMPGALAKYLTRIHGGKPSPEDVRLVLERLEEHGVLVGDKEEFMNRLLGRLGRVTFKVKLEPAEKQEGVCTWVLRPLDEASWEALRKLVEDENGPFARYRRVTYNIRDIDAEGRVELRPLSFSMMYPWYSSRVVYLAGALIPEVVRELRRRGFEVEVPEDIKRIIEGRPEKKLDLSLLVKLRPYQEEALREWRRNGYRGTIVLPTGAGKTIVALKAIEELGVPTLIVVPTRELLRQWAEKIEKLLGFRPGILGGGEHEIKPITITTYASAYRHAGELADKFLLVIADEAHHVPAETYKEAMSRLLAPYRLALTATPEREDANEPLIYLLTGRQVYYRKIIDLIKKGWLAPILVEFIPVPLTPEEHKKIIEYMKRAEQETYGKKKLAWKNKALQVAQKAFNKYQTVVDLVGRHLRQGDKILVFVKYVDQAKAIYKLLSDKYPGEIRLLYGGMSKKEREKSLSDFRKGLAHVLVLTQVGEEGIDIPDANVEIWMSYDRNKRAFIQRLGRVLRPGKEKVSHVYILYTDLERRKGYIRNFVSYINTEIPQDEMRRIIQEKKTSGEEKRAYFPRKRVSKIRL